MGFNIGIRVERYWDVNVKFKAVNWVGYNEFTNKGGELDGR